MVVPRGEAPLRTKTSEYDISEEDDWRNGRQRPNRYPERVVQTETLLARVNGEEVEGL